jgi:DNA-binding response OmpR family regulator
MDAGATCRWARCWWWKIRRPRSSCCRTCWARAGYAVRQAPDGELALWSAQARPPELILLDVRMPGIDGFEVCRRLKESPQLHDIPVVFLSAQSDLDDKVRGFQAGAIDFIGKPYQAEEVLARTRAHIALARSQRALAASQRRTEHDAGSSSIRRARIACARSGWRRWARWWPASRMN